jgi:hypothetical protein
MNTPGFCLFGEPRYNEYGAKFLRRPIMHVELKYCSQ